NMGAGLQRYCEAFLARGFDLAGGDPTEIAARIAGSPIRNELVDALDDWATFTVDEELRDRLFAILRRADPGEWLDRLRDPLVRSHGWRLVALAQDALQSMADGRQPPRTAALASLAEAMRLRRFSPIGVLRHALARTPNDFHTAYLLGLFSERTDRAAAV